MAKAPPRRTNPERGAVLVLALVLVATFGLLAWSLLASTDLAGRARGASLAQQQAERAAASGVEWAAAKLLAGELYDGRTDLVLGDGCELQVVFARSSSPQVRARARSRGAEVTLAADLRTESGAPLPYALAVFEGSPTLQQDMTVVGSAYLAGDPSIAVGGTGKLILAGDLLLTAAAIDAGRVTQSSGVTRFGVTALAKPVADTTPFATMTSGAVTVTRYVGTATVTGQTLNGIVVVDLEAGQLFTLRNTTLNGTLVVRRLSSGLPILGGGSQGTQSTSGGGKLQSTTSSLGDSLLGSGEAKPVVRLAGASRIVGGTAWTGNLAVLMPDCDLDGSASTGCTLHGVVLTEKATDLKNVQVDGQLVVIRDFALAQAGLTVSRGADFVPDTPLGVTWPGTAAVRVGWRGPQ